MFSTVHVVRPLAANNSASDHDCCAGPRAGCMVAEGGAAHARRGEVRTSTRRCLPGLGSVTGPVRRTAEVLTGRIFEAALSGGTDS